MKVLLQIVLIFIVIGCADDVKTKPTINMKQLQEDLLKANKRALVLESEQIDKYIQEKGIDAVKTETGLRYFVYEQSKVGEVIKEGEVAAVKYRVSLLDGTVCYSTKDKAEEFSVGKDYVESGLHEGITYMGVGDKAIIIIPSHLAHGLAGDLKKIPFRSTIVYDIELVAIK